MARSVVGSSVAVRQRRPKPCRRQPHRSRAACATCAPVRPGGSRRPEAVAFCVALSQGWRGACPAARTSACQLAVTGHWLQHAGVGAAQQARGPALSSRPARHGLDRACWRPTPHAPRITPLVLGAALRSWPKLLPMRQHEATPCTAVNGSSSLNLRGHLAAARCGWDGSACPARQSAGRATWRWGVASGAQDVVRPMRKGMRCLPPVFAGSAIHTASNCVDRHTRATTRTARKWRSRWTSEGVPGMLDRRSRPDHSPRRLPTSAPANQRPPVQRGVSARSRRDRTSP